MASSYPSRGSVYWFDPEPVTGSEIRKIRPCIVVSPDEMNQRLKTVIIVPVTSKLQAWPFRTNIKLLNHQSSAACDQLRSVDKSRLRGFISELTPSDEDKVFAVLRAIFAPR